MDRLFKVPFSRPLATTSSSVISDFPQSSNELGVSSFGSYSYRLNKTANQRRSLDVAKSDDVLEGDIVYQTTGYDDGSDTAGSTSAGETDFDEKQLSELITAVKAYCLAGDSNDAHQAVNKRLRSSRRPEVKGNHCLQNNLKTQQHYREALQCIEEGIEVIQQKLAVSREELRLRKYQTKPSPLLEKLPNYPYFKDCKKFTAPMNADAIAKKNTEGFNFQHMPATIKWQKWEMKLLDLAVRKEVFLTLERPLDIRKQRLETELKKKEAKGRPTKKIRRLLRAVGREIDELTAKPMFEVLYNSQSSSTIDWMKISTTHFKGKRTPEECEGMWLTNQNVKINRDPWTKDEIDRLLLIANKHKNQDWEKIAEIVGNGRSPFQCALYQQLQLNHERAKWTPQADKRLTALVKENNKKGYINFEKVASAMSGRTAKQVRRRWCDTLDPAIKKGDFTKTEDTILNTARFYHKLNFRQIARLLPGRTPNQLRCRYTRLEFDNPKQPWCQTEDEKLLQLIKNNTQRNWNYMVKHFNDRNLQQLRARYHRLRLGAKLANKKLMLLEPDFDPDNETQRNMNYVPDYDREHSTLTMKYIPVASLMRMVNRKGRRGKRARKPDVMDKEMSVYFRNVHRIRKYGRNAKTFCQAEIDKMNGTLKFYAEALGINFDYEAIQKHSQHLANMDPVLDLDFKRSAENNMLLEFITNKQKSGWDPSKKTLTTLLPPCYGSLVGLRSLMLSKPILESINSFADDEKEERKKVERKLEVDKFAHKFGLTIDNTQHLDTPPCTPHHSPEGEKKTSRLKPTFESSHLKLDETPINTSILKSPETPPQTTDSETSSLITVLGASEHQENQKQTSVLQSASPMKTSDEESPQSPLQTSEVKSPETPLNTAVHLAIPRGYKYKDTCLTSKVGLCVESADVPVEVEETIIKVLLQKCAKETKLTGKQSSEKSAKKTNGSSHGCHGVLLDFKTFLNVLFKDKYEEELEVDKILWNFEVQCLEELAEINNQEKTNEKKKETITEIIREFNNPSVFIEKEKEIIRERLEELKNPENHVEQMRKFYTYQISCKNYVQYYLKCLEDLETPDVYMKQRENYFQQQLQELELHSDEYIKKISSKCERQLEDIIKCEEDLRKKKELCERRLDVFNNPEDLLQRLKLNFEKSFESFETSEELINKITQMRPSITDFLEYGLSNIEQTEEGSDEDEWQDLNVDCENKKEMLSFETALSLWCQRFISIFYMPAVLSMIDPPEDSRKDLFEGERMACVSSNEEDSTSDLESQAVDISTPVQAKDQCDDYKLCNPPIPEEERKELLLEKWLRYRQYKIRELEERKRRGLKDEWDIEQERFQAMDREANREMVERIPGKRGRPRRLRRRRRPIPVSCDDNVSEGEEAEETNIFLQKTSGGLQICSETWAVLDKFKNPVHKLEVPEILQDEHFTTKNIEEQAEDFNSDNSDYHSDNSDYHSDNSDYHSVLDGSDDAMSNGDEMNDGDKMSE